MRTLNVRLAAEDAAIAEALKERGIAISGLVRDALRAKYLEVQSARTPRDLRELLDRLDDMPAEALPLVDPHDRAAVRAHVRRKLRR